MRLAFVSSLVPVADPRSGFAIANRAVVDRLVALGHEVVSIGVRQSVTDRAVAGSDVLATMNLENAKASTGDKLRWAARAFRHRLPFAAAKLLPVGRGSVRAALDRAQVDGFVINSYQMAAAFPFLTERPYVYLAHNVEARTAKENVRASRGLERWLYRRDARLLDALEARLCGGARHVWCLSEEDRAVLALDRARSGVLPLLLPEAGAGTVESAKPFDAALIGTWTWSANAKGLRWFVGEVLPYLPTDMRIAIAGSVPDGFDLSDERLVVLGRVDSADGFLAQGHVVPLIARGGTGIQLKTIEAFQRGLPTVATASALRGIGSIPSNCTAADDARDFAQALIDAARAGRGGRDLRVDPAAWIEKQRRTLDEALARGVAALG